MDDIPFSCPALGQITRYIAGMAALGAVAGELIDMAGVDARSAAHAELAGIVNGASIAVVTRCSVCEWRIGAAAQRIARRSIVARVRGAGAYHRRAGTDARLAVVLRRAVVGVEAESAVRKVGGDARPRSALTAALAEIL